MLVDASPGSLDRRVVRAQQVVANQIFGSMLRRALAAAEAEAPIADYDRLRAIAVRVLADDFGLDLAGVVLTFTWDPGAKRLGIWCRSRATPEQVAAMVAGLAPVAAESRAGGAA